MLSIADFNAEIERHLMAYAKEKDPSFDATKYAIKFNLSDMKCSFQGREGSQVKLKKDVLSAIAIESYDNSGASKMTIESSSKNTSSVTRTYVRTEVKNSGHTFNIGLNLAYMGIGASMGYAYNRGKSQSTENGESQTNTYENDKRITLELEKDSAMVLLGEDCLIDVKTQYYLIYHFTGNISYWVVSHPSNGVIQSVGSVVQIGTVQQGPLTYPQHPQTSSKAVALPKQLPSKHPQNAGQVQKISLFELFHDARYGKTPFDEKSKIDQTATLVLKVPVHIHNLKRVFQYHCYPTNPMPVDSLYSTKGVSAEVLTNPAQKPVNVKYKEQFFKDTLGETTTAQVTQFFKRPPGTVDKKRKFECVEMPKPQPDITEQAEVKENDVIFKY